VYRNIHAFFLYKLTILNNKLMIELPTPKIKEPLLDVFIQAYNRLPNDMNELVTFCKEKELV